MMTFRVMAMAMAMVMAMAMAMVMASHFAGLALPVGAAGLCYPHNHHAHEPLRGASACPGGWQGTSVPQC
jgi:hypothetical protein